VSRLGQPPLALAPSRIQLGALTGTGQLGNERALVKPPNTAALHFGEGEEGRMAGTLGTEKGAVKPERKGSVQGVSRNPARDPASRPSFAAIRLLKCR
jgi:hypothetical protein